MVERTATDGVGEARGEPPVRGRDSMGVVHHSTRFLRAARRPPTLYNREGDRHATWLELFFDLVYVVAVAELGGLLHENHSLTGFLGFAGLFVIVWWTWLGFSTYADQFDTDDIVHRVGMVAVMFGVIVLTGTIPSALHGGSFAFALAYLLLRTLYIGMYFRVWLNVPEYRQFSAFVIGSTTLSASVWAVSLFFPEPTRFAIWGLSFVVSIVLTVRGYRRPRNHPPTHLALLRTAWPVYHPRAR
ncbi:low temperature requirement protein A [Haladaptatus sp. ZSTT2]|uniref:low temperature requirement protein A n=1 Tax=Haladaptatus sp. ZSTT2 TaxID=3120515 RepID=UPI00300F7A44